MKIEELNLSSLKYFLDAVELGSITLSSEKNHISRPAVSQAILRLESWYGKKLLRHEKRSFELTDDGKIFFRSAKKIYIGLENQFHSLNDQDKNLRIGFSASIADIVFPKIKAILKKSNNPVIKIGKTHDLLKLVEQKEVGVAFLVHDSQPSHVESLIIDEGMFGVYSKNGKLSDILITTEKRSEVSSLIKYLMKEKIQIKNHIEVESWSVAVNLAENLGGMCLVPNFLKKHNLKETNGITWMRKCSILMINQREEFLTDLECEVVDSCQDV